jgi:acetate---CoA ligase (ADP-forming)
VGFGGQLAEVVAEVAATPCPVTYEQADACLAELFGGRWASHGRGLNPLQRTAICDLMVKVGELPVRYADVGEVEMNPVLVTETGAIIVVDWIVR